ncbi:MAG TPA: hypothetical protein VF933_30635, partial [Streptosporangiaceae bacterium]
LPRAGHKAGHCQRCHQERVHGPPPAPDERPTARANITGRWIQPNAKPASTAGAIRSGLTPAP